MVSAYADDSQTANHVVVAMYVSTDNQWDTFLVDWQRDVLAPKNLAYFHATKFFGRRTRAFQGWTESEYRTTFTAAVNVIKNRTAFGVVSSVDRRQYKAQLIRTNMSAYTYATFNCMFLAAHLARLNGLGDEIIYVFDSGAGDYPETAKLLSLIMTLPRFKRNLGLGTFAPGDKYRYPQIQAADIPAYCWTAEKESAATGFSDAYFNTLWATRHHFYLEEDDLLRIHAERLVKALEKRRREKWARIKDKKRRRGV